MVGDDLEADVAGALNVGMWAVYLEHRHLTRPHHLLIGHGLEVIRFLTP